MIWSLEIDRDAGTTFGGDAIKNDAKSVCVEFDIMDDNKQAHDVSKLIGFHIIFDIKMDSTRKFRFVARGHMNESHIL